MCPPTIWFSSPRLCMMMMMANSFAPSCQECTGSVPLSAVSMLCLWCTSWSTSAPHLYATAECLRLALALLPSVTCVPSSGLMCWLPSLSTYACPVVRVQTIRHARTHYVGKSQSCMFYRGGQHEHGPRHWVLPYREAAAPGALDPCCVDLEGEADIKLDANGQACVLRVDTRALDGMLLVLYYEGRWLPRDGVQPRLQTAYDGLLRSY